MEDDRILTFISVFSENKTQESLLRGNVTSIASKIQAAKNDGIPPGTCVLRRWEIDRDRAAKQPQFDRSAHPFENLVDVREN
ncbi:hypothetical protein IQ235_07645 [Oscillatoriales cyanobacterium LEGE 11467]|uniref:Uncharacterized protein n=1 Tax=Zarconia navalis LEGE 11467 TaxID=1828826 RepID=A0A928VXN0_9CYAN|nr:hypothetical protein [Zarconia navalis]MBE9040652.1 hypothetical protein [Zarconia navalis LEGE 11467]